LLVRDGLLTMRQQARNQRHALAQWPVHIARALDQLDAVIADLDRRIATLEDELATVLRDGAWAESASLLGTITGIGLVTTAWLLVATLNFAACASAEGAAAYAGLVPLAHDSGSSVRGRATIGHAGHVRLRTALYLATLTAARFNPVIRAQYERLRAAGKPPKVARCAAARKLLHLAFAVVTKKRAFDPAYRAAGRSGRRANRQHGGRGFTPDVSCPHPSGTAVIGWAWLPIWYSLVWAGRIRSPEASHQTRSDWPLTTITVSFILWRVKSTIRASAQTRYKRPISAGSSRAVWCARLT